METLICSLYFQGFLNNETFCCHAGVNHRRGAVCGLERSAAQGLSFGKAFAPGEGLFARRRAPCLRFILKQTSGDSAIAAAGPFFTGHGADVALVVGIPGRSRATRFVVRVGVR